MRVKIKSQKHIPIQSFMVIVEETKQRNKSKEDIGSRKKSTQLKLKKFPECQLREVPKWQLCSRPKRKQSRPKQEDNYRRDRCVQEKMELVIVSDRSDHVENCTETHFMKLLESTDRLCQTKLTKWKNEAWKTKGYTRTTQQQKKMNLCKLYQ